MKENVNRNDRILLPFIASLYCLVRRRAKAFSNRNVIVAGKD